MYVLHVELRGLTASFRVPHMFKYHRSLPLPPYTSVIGMFGAAIGKDMATAQTIFEHLGLRVGIAGSYAGGCNDTWRVLTTKNSESDVVERQILFKPRYHVVFCSDDKQAVTSCEKAFCYPVYPLSLGRPDDLANAIVRPFFPAQTEPLRELINTVVVGIPAAQVDPSLFDPEDPMDPGPCTLLYRLPTRFRFIDGYSYDRIAGDFRDFTFVGNHNITLREPVASIRIPHLQDNNGESFGVPLLEI